MTKSRSNGDPSTASTNDMRLFRVAMRGVKPLDCSGHVSPRLSHPAPIPRRLPQDEQQEIDDSLSDPISWGDAASDEEALTYLRPGMGRITLRKLRRGFWGVQAELDLHGMTRVEARQQLTAFLNTGKKQRWRCVRIIHGKGLGSKNHEPILKTRVRHWLTQRDEVLAFCQARAADGGGGAVLVLLKSPAKF